MPLFSKGTSVEELGSCLRVVMSSATGALSFAQLLGKPATYFYRPQSDAAVPSAAELIERSFKSSTAREVTFEAAAERLRQAKPGDRHLRAIYDAANTFSGHMSQSFAAHNNATLAHLKGDARAAAKHTREGLRCEKTALSEVMKFLLSLSDLQKKHPDLYARLGLDQEPIEQFADRYAPFRFNAGKFSVWETEDE